MDGIEDNVLTRFFKEKAVLLSPQIKKDISGRDAFVLEWLNTEADPILEERVTVMAEKLYDHVLRWHVEEKSRKLGREASEKEVQVPSLDNMRVFIVLVMLHLKKFDWKLE